MISIFDFVMDRNPFGLELIENHLVGKVWMGLRAEQ